MNNYLKNLKESRDLRVYARSPKSPPKKEQEQKCR